MVCPFLNGMFDYEALTLRRTYRWEGVFQDRSDPLAFLDNYLHEHYNFSGDLMHYLCRLLVPQFSTTLSSLYQITEMCDYVAYSGVK